MTSSVEKAGDDHPADKKAYQRNVATHSQLERTAQSMSAGSAVCQAGPKHGYDAAYEGHDTPF